MGLAGSIQKVYIDPTGGVWASKTGSGAKVYRYDPASTSWAGVVPHGAYDMTYVNGELWLATPDTDVVRYNPATSSITYFINRANSNLPRGSVRAIAVDAQGRVFIGMMTNGFCVYHTLASALPKGAPIMGKPYPNPVRDELVWPIQMEKVGSLSLYNLQGVLVARLAPLLSAEGLVVRLPALPVGRYYLVLQGEVNGHLILVKEPITFY